jgi:poly(hydroxyalkanoate) granule-associated protein
MTEDIEVNVRQIHDDEQEQSASASRNYEAMQRLFLAGIGALSIAYEESDKLLKQFVERGEEVQKDGPKIVDEIVEGVRQHGQEGISSDQLQAQLDKGVQQLLQNLNIPSKSDIDDLNEKIDKLSARLEEMSSSSSSTKKS